MTSDEVRRKRRLIMALGSSASAKLVSIGIQVLAIPIAVSALGAQRYGVFVSLTSVLAWISLVDLGVGPGLIIGLSRATGPDSEAQRARLVNAALILTGLLTAAIAGCIVIASMGWRLDEILGAAYRLYADELSAAGPLMVLLVLLQMLLSPIEAVRSGYQEQHVSNSLQVLSGLATAIGLVTVARMQPSLQSMVIVLYAPNVAAKLINAVFLFRSRAYLLPRSARIDRSVVRVFLGAGGAFTLVQIGSLLEQYGVLFLVARMAGPVAAAEFGVMVKLVSLIAGSALMVTQSLWPAYSEAIAKGEWDWVRKVYRFTFYGCCAAAICSVALGLVGPLLVSTWTRGEIVPGAILCFGMAGVLAVGIWTHVHYMTLVGMNDLFGPSVVMCFRAIVGLLLASALIPNLGAGGAALALFTADAGVAATYLYARTQRNFRRHRALGHK